MKLTLVCPHCSAELELEDIAPGARFECPGCGGECVAPGAPPAPAAPRRQLRIPARRDTAPPPVSVTVQASRPPVLLTALLLVTAILVLVVVGCHLFGVFAAAQVVKQTAEAFSAATIAKTETVEADDAPIWKAEVRTDTMTDARTLRATLRENNPPGTIFERPATLALELDERDGIRFGVFGVDAFSLGRFEAAVRWDDAPPETLPWTWSGGAGTCLRDGRELYDKLRASRRLLLRVPLPGKHRDAEFSLGGLADALNRADPGRAIRDKAERVQRESGAWKTSRDDDGTVTLAKRARDDWPGVAGRSHAILAIVLGADGAPGVVAIQTGETILAGGQWSTRIGASPAARETWRATDSGGCAYYGGDPVALVGRLQRARTLVVDVHAGFEHAEVEWRLDGLADALAAARRGVADL